VVFIIARSKEFKYRVNTSFRLERLTHEKLKLILEKMSEKKGEKITIQDFIIILIEKEIEKQIKYLKIKI
jgi:hypothetical protein